MYNKVLSFAIALNTIPRIIDFGTGALMDGQMYSPTGRWWYYTGQAASFVLLMMCMDKKVNSKLYSIVLWIAISNLADEMFFDPKCLGINEIVFALFIVVKESDLLQWLKKAKWKTIKET